MKNIVILLQPITFDESLQEINFKEIENLIKTQFENFKFFV